MFKKQQFPIESRALSLLDFNGRVLSKALDKSIPLIERFKYTCIVSSNLDEFYEIRYSELLERSKNRKEKLSRDGNQYPVLLKNIGEKALNLNNQIQKVLYSDIIPELEKELIYLITDKKWPVHLNAWTKTLFKREIENVVTPIVLDEARPFPNIINKSISYIAILEGDKDNKVSLGIVQLPHYIPRVFKVPPRNAKKTNSFIFVGALMRDYMSLLFPDHNVLDSYQFKLTRNSDLFISEDAEDLRKALKGSLTKRNLGAGVRLEVSTRMPKKTIDFLQKHHDIRDDCIFHVRGPSNLYRFIGLLDNIKKPHLKFPIHTPRRPLKKSESVFDWINQEDRILHHPYDSFDPIVDLLNEAANDPQVLSIKQTIYRTGDKSEIMDALIRAAENGKEVTVAIELMARFDEETNVNWSSKLEAVGAHVIHSRPNLKCHAKMLLITRRVLNKKINKFEIKSYAHLGTGNYSVKNAKTYTDFSFLTTNKIICDDIRNIFAYLSGSRKKFIPKKLHYLPQDNRKNFIRLIRRESRFAKQGKKSRIIIKVNSLSDHIMLKHLYDASSNGVKVDLIVRGMCSIVPGIKRLSDNIKIHSNIGRFLEHHRIFYFHNNGDNELFLSSSDFLERNLDRRIEVTFPIEDKFLANLVYEEGLKMMINDADRWVKVKEGKYKKISKKNKRPAQELIIQG